MYDSQCLATFDSDHSVYQSFHSYAVLSHGQYHADFTPTGNIRHTLTDQSQCEVVYDKPNCTGCPKTFEIRACDNIVNCWTADPDVYSKAAFQFNTAQPENPNPCVIVMAKTPECIQDVVKKVRKIRTEGKEYSDLRIAIRGGRHSYIGASTVSKGVVVDVSRFDDVSQHNETELMTVGAGIILSKLYYHLWSSEPNRLLYPGGTCPTVGLSGLTLGGGQGVIGRKYGLSADQVVELKMVNSTGDVMTINNMSHEDLFWALRGGGNGNFGIVYEFTLRRYVIPKLNKDYLIYFHNPSDWHTIITKWQEFITSATFKEDYNVWSQLTVTPSFLLIAFHIADNELKPKTVEGIEALAHVPGTTSSGYHPNTPYIECFYTPNNYSGSIAFWAGCTKENQCGTTQNLIDCLELPTVCDGKPFRMNSGYQNKPLNDEGIKTIIDHILKIEELTGCLDASVQLDTLGGKINEVSPNSTAFPHRRNIITYQFLSYFFKGCNKTAMIKWQDDFHQSMLNCSGMTQGAYRNYANLNLTSHNKRYFLENLENLTEIKNTYDPDNIFSYSQSIPTEFQKIERRLFQIFGDYWPLYFVVGCVVTIVIFLIYHSRSRHPHQD